MNERDIERTASQLGDRAAADLDVERVVARVRERLRAEPVARGTVVARWLALAAALALAVGVGYMSFAAPERGGGGGTGLAAVPGLEELSSRELGEVLDSLVLEDQTVSWSGASLEDLDAEQLAQLLTTLEG
jgi:hypothetical protein